MELSQIIAGCRRQDRGSQYRLYTLFYNYAMSIARRYTDGLEAAEEIVNDTFFKVFTKIDKLPEEQAFRFWLRRILINTAIDRYRSAQQELKLLSFNLSTPEGETESGVVEELTKDQILAHLDRLPPAYRTVFNLYVVDGYSHEEISKMLGITVGGSKSNLARARQHLKNIFQQDFEQFGKI